jgi:DNA-binding MarR family transcriptional regulator
MGRKTSDAAEPSEFKLAESPALLLHRALQLANERFAVLVGEDGLSLRQFAVLAAANDNPGLSQSDLVRATSIDRSTLADMIARMEKRGLLTREASTQDARANAIRLTPEGDAMLQWACQHAKAADAAIMDSMPRPKRKPFHATLILLAEKADEAFVDVERAQAKKARRKARKVLAEEKKAKERAKDAARAARAKRSKEKT